jgi:hypothetical protein
MLAMEAQIIKAAADMGETASVEAAQCQIDGMLNAIVRLRGAREAAEYAFALSDRVASGLPAPDDFRAIEVAPVAALVDAPADPQPAPAALGVPLPPRWPVYLWGLTHGALLALWLRWWWG